MLPSLVNEEVGHHLMLIADECHRVGATEMSKVLSVRRRYSLGLSATPDREEEEDGEGGQGVRYEDSLVGKELGGVIYELTLAKAVELGIVPSSPSEISVLLSRLKRANMGSRPARLRMPAKSIQRAASSGRL